METNDSSESVIDTKIHCKHFVLRKKRYCRMTVSTGYDYCGEHLPPKLDETNENLNTKIRVPCPLDNTHTCYASKLAKHLKVCNAKEGPQPEYICRNINSGEKSNEIQSKRNLSEVPVSRIKEVIQKVNYLYEENIKNAITSKILSHTDLKEEISNPQYGVTTKKHLIQIASLIGHLHDNNLFQPNTCYVEFGAGKGQFSCWISKSAQMKSSVLLVERASLRHKLDNKLDKNESNVYRIRADIADLLLNQVEQVKTAENLVAVTKHLCGEATDLALRCLANSLREENKVLGLVMAFCCHHRCFWNSYVGKQYFQSNELTESDFNLICGLVSWATCGTGKSRDEKRENTQENNEEIQIRTRDEELGLSREERELVGKKCKLLIDYGRMCYLKQLNFDCNLYYYVEQQVTLENVCLVACKKIV